MDYKLEPKPEWQEQDNQILEEIIGANGHCDKIAAVRETYESILLSRFTDLGEEKRFRLFSRKVGLENADLKLDETLYQKAQLYATTYNGKKIIVKVGWNTRAKDEIQSNNKWYKIVRSEGHGDVHPSMFEGKFYTIMEDAGNNLFDLLSGTSNQDLLKERMGYLFDFYGVSNPHNNPDIKRMSKNLLHTLREDPNDLNEHNRLVNGEAQRAVSAIIKKDIEFIRKCKELDFVKLNDKYTAELSDLEVCFEKLSVDDLCGPYCPTVLAILDPRRNFWIREADDPKKTKPDFFVGDQQGEFYELIHAPMPIVIGILYEFMKAEEVLVANEVRNKLLREYVGSETEKPSNLLWASDEESKKCAASKLEDLGRWHTQLIFYKTKVQALSQIPKASNSSNDTLFKDAPKAQQ